MMPFYVMSLRDLPDLCNYLPHFVSLLKLNGFNVVARLEQ